MGAWKALCGEEAEEGLPAEEATLGQQREAPAPFEAGGEASQGRPGKGREWRAPAVPGGSMAQLAP